MGEKGFIGIGDSKKFGVLIEKKGLFDYYSLYNLISEWYSSHKYDFNEVEFSTKTKPQGKEYTIEYEGSRKVTDYIKFYIVTRIEISGAKTLNIKTTKQQKGHVKVFLKAYYEKDYKDKWKYFPFIRKIYENYIIKEKILKYEGKLWSEANNLIDEIKKSLNLITR